MTPAFDRYGPDDPLTPVIVSVPHAGREYPLALRSALRVPLYALSALEDRHVDSVAAAAREDETMFVQRLPRAWIDLNRAEHERDPRVDEGACPGHPTAKVRSGLGIVPRRTTAVGDLWRRRLSGDEVTARILADHRPYHAAVENALARARARFGCAVLLDLHSMPPIAASGVKVVVGDRFGRAAGARFVHRVERAIDDCGIAHGRNVPYPGGHILERHGRPAAQIHAIQLEIDRALYLDARLNQPGDGLADMAALVRTVIDALTDEALGFSALAAE